MPYMFSLADMTHLQSFSELLVQKMRKQDFLTYFQKLSLVSFEDKKITLGVVSEFIRDNISHRFSDILLTCAREIWGEVDALSIIVDNQIENPTYSQVIDCRKTFKTAQSSQEKAKVATAKSNPGREDFSSRFALDHFIVGPSNQLAYSAAEAVVRKPGSLYNPLFVYSDVGLGKTHLLQ